MAWKLEWQRSAAAVASVSLMRAARSWTVSFVGVGCRVSYKGVHQRVVGDIFAESGRVEAA